MAAVRVHIHHRGDCCVCPEEGLVCVSRLQSYQPWWLVASQETKTRLDSSGTRSQVCAAIAAEAGFHSFFVSLMSYLNAI